MTKPLVQGLGSITLYFKINNFITLELLLHTCFFICAL